MTELAQLLALAPPTASVLTLFIAWDCWRRLKRIERVQFEHETRIARLEGAREAS